MIGDILVYKFYIGKFVISLLKFVIHLRRQIITQFNAIITLVFLYPKF